MQILPTIFPLLVLTARTIMAESAAWDPNYNNGGLSTANIACSNTFSGSLADIPEFPFIGASPEVEHWGSANCGKCWHLHYEGMTVKIRAVDASRNGWVISEAALNALTNNNAGNLGRVYGVTALPVAC